MNIVIKILNKILGIRIQHTKTIYHGKVCFPGIEKI